MQVSSLSFILWCNDLFDVRIIATCKDFVLIVYNFFFCLCNFCQIVAHHHECINNGSCWVMSHRFQELGRLQRSSGHTQSPRSPGITCFRHIHCNTATAVVLRLGSYWLIRYAYSYMYHIQYWTHLKSVQTVADQKTTHCMTFVDFWQKILMHLQLTADAKFSMLFQDWSPQTLGDIDMDVSPKVKIGGGACPPDP